MATILSQQVGGLRNDMEQGFARIDDRFTKVYTRFDEVDKKIDDLVEPVGEALHNFDNTIDEQLKDHEQRITKLEATTT